MYNPDGQTNNMRAHARARTHTQTRARARTRTHTLNTQITIDLCSASISLYVQSTLYLLYIPVTTTQFRCLHNCIGTSRDCLSLFTVSIISSAASHFIWYMCRSALRLSLSLSSCCTFWAASCVRAMADDPSFPPPTLGVNKGGASIFGRRKQHDTLRCGIYEDFDEPLPSSHSAGSLALQPHSLGLPTAAAYPGTRQPAAQRPSVSPTQHIIVYHLIQ